MELREVYTAIGGRVEKWVGRPVEDESGAWFIGRAADSDRHYVRGITVYTDIHEAVGAATETINTLARDLAAFVRENVAGKEVPGQ